MSARPRHPKWLAAGDRAALRNIPLLADFDDEQFDQLASAVDRRYTRANEWLFHLGDPPEAIYVIRSGRYAAIGRDGHVLREMTAGEAIGDLGVIAGAPRSAGVRALRDSVVWRIAADKFEEMLTSTPQLQSALLRSMARMLQQSRSADISQRPRVIGVLSPGNEAALPIVDAITTRLGSYGQSAVIAPPSGPTAKVRTYDELVELFSETVDRAERGNNWVFVVADRGSSDLWRRYVVRQSDRLVVLVDQSHPPDDVDQLVTQRPLHLINCVKEPDLSWWDALQPVSHHPADDAGFGALARRIAGRSLGLVLAGGGVRGMAHFGVYEELVRAGIVIDRFGGTSTGALASAAFALGMGAAEGADVARQFASQGNPFGDYALPAVALTRGGRWDRLINKFAGSTLIEHLSREFFSVSSDLVSGDQIIHRRGRLSLAVRASISIPGLLPPVQDGERILVDGALVNNLPADVMCADPDGDVICVDLLRKFVPSKGFSVLPGIVAPPGFVRRFLTGTDTPLPSLQETLLRAMDFSGGSRNLREIPRVAAVIEPDVSAIGILNFKHIDAAVEAGRVAARAALDANPQLVR